MAPVKVQAIYDFAGEPGSSELSIKTGEVLTVTRQDVGEGWWEGTNEAGETGLFPAAYVENYEVADYWDEDWDDDSESGPPPVAYDPPQSNSQPNIINPVAPPETANKGEIKQHQFGRKRFSTSIKTGGDGAYIVGEPVPNIPSSERVRIVETENGVSWPSLGEPYICMVASPKKESKLKGLKSYIAYQLTPSFNNIQVSRRYKHFDWLHERLDEKYCLIPIPPLPDKQISGRYEEQFIEHRKNQLQAFVDYVCRHPILSRSPVWQHFITCTDEKMWKVGKRKAEKDELVGENYFFAIEAPEKAIHQYTLEQETLSCSQFVQNMDSAVKHLMETSLDQTKKHQGPYKRELQKIGNSFYSLGQAMSSDTPKYMGHENLITAIKKTGEAYNEIGIMFEEQPKLDWEPLGDMLYVYKGILASMPDILMTHKRALQTRKECTKLAFEQKISSSDLEGVTRRTDVVSYALLAEINNFHNERAEQVSKSVKNFLAQQVMFYTKITETLQLALSAFDS